MKNFFTFLILSLVTLTISVPALAQPATVSSVSDVRLIERREAVKQREVLCLTGSHQGQYSELMGRCAQGDIVLFSGLSCLAARLAGDEATADARCRDVARAQGPNGRWWRGESRIGSEEDFSFSRDMGRGVLAYLLGQGVVNPTPERFQEAQNAARRWLNWIQTEGDNNLCPSAGTWNACRLTLGTRCLMYHVFKALDVLPSSDTSLGRALERASHHVYHFLPMEAAFAPVGNALHLKAVSVLILRIANPQFAEASKWFLDGAAHTLATRDSENYNFRFLDEGPTPGIVKQVLQQCPVERPLPDLDRRDFQWQRPSESGDWKESDGHDCVYMLNLTLAHRKGTLRW